MYSSAFLTTYPHLTGSEYEQLTRKILLKNHLVFFPFLRYHYESAQCKNQGKALQQDN